MTTLYKGCTHQEAAQYVAGKNLDGIRLSYDMALAEKDGHALVVFEFDEDPIYETDGQTLVFDSPKAVRYLRRNVKHIYKL